GGPSEENDQGAAQLRARSVGPIPVGRQPERGYDQRLPRRPEDRRANPDRQASRGPEAGLHPHDAAEVRLWRQVSNLPVVLGKLETCRHSSEEVLPMRANTVKRTLRSGGVS